MKIALVLGALTRMGGTERHAVELASGLAARGHRVRVACGRVGADIDVAENAFEVQICGPARRDLERAALGLRSEGWLVQTLDRVGHGHVFRAGGGAHGHWQERRPWAVSSVAHAVTGVDRRELAAEQRAATGARIVICNSELAAAGMRRWLPWVEDRLSVVRNGVDLSRFGPCAERRGRAREAWRLPPDGRAVLFVGNGFRRKGLASAVEAFDRVATGRDRLVVAGRDRAATRWRRWVTRRLGSRAIWAGPLSRPEDWLVGADVVLLPTRFDPASNTTLQAMASGCAAITTAHDGTAEILPPGLVVEAPVEVDAVASLLAETLDRAGEAGRACRAVAERWPLERMVDAMEAVYAEVSHGR